MGMFDENSSSYESNFGLDSNSTDLPDIAAIIRRCIMLPKSVRSSEITKTYERLLDRNELDRLTNPQSFDSQDVEDIERLFVRRMALSPKLGLYLTCVLIRLPGVFYTIEIVTISGEVVHWEWQQI